MVKLLVLAALAVVASAQIDVAITAPQHQDVAAAAARIISNAGKRKQDKKVAAKASNAINSYTIEVHAGKKNEAHRVVVDTGSSNLWVGCSGAPYKPAKGAKALDRNLNIQYGIGAAFGPAYVDTVQYAPGLTLKNKIISSVNDSFCGDLAGIGGIAGFGPIDLSDNFDFQNGTHDPTLLEPPVVDLAKKQHDISHRVLGISFEPTSVNKTVRNGLLTFGGVNPSRFEGKIHYVPQTKVYPSKFYWGIDLSLSVGGKKLSNGTATHYSGIVDTGTTLIGVVTPILQGYFKALGVPVTYAQDSATSNVDSTLPSISIKDVKKVKALTFEIGGQDFTMSGEQLIAPAHQVDGGKKDRAYLLFYGMDVSPRANIPVIVGQKFLERFYSVYDSDKNRLGFARTKYSAKNCNKRALH